METVMSFLGYSILAILIAIEFLIKVLCGVVFFSLKPLFKWAFVDYCCKCIEKYTHLSENYYICSKIYELWN